MTWAGGHPRYNKIEFVFSKEPQVLTCLLFIQDTGPFSILQNMNTSYKVKLRF